MERATEYEYLKWFFCNADFGPGDADVREMMKNDFIRETQKDLPIGYNEED